ncbi:MAG: hypothetical protein ACI8Z5_000136 [Lentimonas sp.]|jgi:hypothetical protein
MTFLDKLEKRFGRWAVPNVVLYIIIAQLVVYALVISGQISFVTLPLIPKAVLGGEVWRLFSFLISPPNIAVGAMSALFLAFFWYIFWMMSSALEQIWGAFRFNVYLLCGVGFTILAAFVGQFVSPATTIVIFPDFLYLSVFLAFAVNHPNVEFAIMLILPVKVKWLAWLAVGLTAFSFLGAPSWGDRIAILGPLVNFYLFFRQDLSNSVESRQRRKAFAKEKVERDNTAFHICSECGATDKTHPERHFRYKSVNGDAVCICDGCRGES